MILNFARVPQVDSRSQSEASSQGWHIPHSAASTPTRHHPIMTFFCPLKVAHSKPDKTHILRPLAQPLFLVCLIFSTVIWHMSKPVFYVHTPVKSGWLCHFHSCHLKILSYLFLTYSIESQVRCEKVFAYFLYSLITFSCFKFSVIHYRQIISWL